MVLVATFVVVVVLFMSVVLTVMLVVAPVLPVLAPAVFTVMMAVAAIKNLGNSHGRPPLHLDIPTAESTRQPWQHKLPRSERSDHATGNLPARPSQAPHTNPWPGPVCSSCQA